MCCGVLTSWALQACRIQFSVSVWKALEAFRKHMANFKPPQNDIIELVRHWSWAMRQYVPFVAHRISRGHVAMHLHWRCRNQVFAEAFEDAVEAEIVKADASHHPGVFYVQAAECARRRHQTYLQLARTVRGE